MLRHRLHFGPYRTPRFRLGQRVEDQRRGTGQRLAAGAFFAFQYRGNHRGLGHAARTLGKLVKVAALKVVRQEGAGIGTPQLV